MWDLKKAIKGAKNCYKIRKCKDKVLMNKFRYNKENKVLVTYDKELGLEKF